MNTTEASQITSNYLDAQEKKRLLLAQSFSQTFKKDLTKRDQQIITTDKMVEKYTALFVSMQETIKKLLIDNLTGCYRRDFFIDQVQKIITDSDKIKADFPNYKGSTVFMIDYDNFKLANDTHKHEFGDLVLSEVAKIVRKHLRRQSDILGCGEYEEEENDIDEEAIKNTAGRHGGDELTALLFDTDLEGATIVAKRIQEEVDNLQIEAPDGTIWKQTISIGVANILPSDKSANEVIARADEAVYEAKHSGKNQIKIYTTT